jgi:hypothetical protein
MLLRTRLKEKRPTKVDLSQVRAIGVEPTRLAATDPKSVASANFATPANDHLKTSIELPANFQQFFLLYIKFLPL